MNRKNFLTAAAVATASLQAFGRINNDEDDSDKPFVIPRKLKAGDIIGITAPAGYITQDEIQPAIIQLQEWGLKVRLGETIGKRDFSFGGTDGERAGDFQKMLDDPQVKAILCARGGYGAVRIIDKLNFDKFKLKPKWIIGFSDITVLHCHLGRNYGIASMHSKMCNSFPEDWTKAEPIQVETILSIRQALMGEKMSYVIPINSNNRKGKTEGILIGGNLKTIETLSATRSDILTAGKILFLEDTGEYLYSLDRMFWHLERSGKLSKLRGLIIGGFKIKPDDPGEEFGRSLYDIVLDKVRSYTYPVCFDFPVGHQKNNFALKCGVRHKLLVGEDRVKLEEV